MKFKLSAEISAVLVAGLVPVASGQSQGTAFSYQGRLNDRTNVANGTYDFRFTLYDSTSNSGTILAGSVTNLALSVDGGLFSVTLDFGVGAITGQPVWLQLDVRTNNTSNFTPLQPRQPLLPVPYAVVAANASNLLGALPVSKLTGFLSAAQITGTVSVAQLPAIVLTNGATGAALTGRFMGDGSGLTNLNHLVAGAPYSYSQEKPAFALWALAEDNNTVPLFSVSQDFGSPNLDGTVTTWGYNLSDDLTYDAGRFFGASWNWELDSPGSDVRSLVLKGAASQSRTNGAYFILETAASSGTPGNHGVFNNSIYVSRKGLVAMGNLTDASDYITSLPFEPYLTGWINIFPSGSAWSGGNAALPPLVVNSQSLISPPVPNSLENNGSAWFLTDGSGNRAAVLTVGVTNKIYAHLNGTNVFFSTQP